MNMRVDSTAFTDNPRARARFIESRKKPKDSCSNAEVISVQTSTA